MLSLCVSGRGESYKAPSSWRFDKRFKLFQIKFWSFYIGDRKNLYLSIYLFIYFTICFQFCFLNQLVLECISSRYYIFTIDVSRLYISLHLPFNLPACTSASGGSLEGLTACNLFNSLCIDINRLELLPTWGQQTKNISNNKNNTLTIPAYKLW